MSSRKSNDAARRALVLVGGNLLLLIALLVFIEGTASVLRIVLTVVHRLPVGERQHTEYDPELGWINLPNLNLPDMYGEGIALHTNAQRFRNTRDFPARVPDGKRRLICSGDSFTLGFGVGDDATWCQALTRIDPGLETVNMGQGGYGIDQAYLWYARDAAAIEHDVQLFAFIDRDIDRMRSDEFQSYGKPLLGLKDGRLVITNAPVSERAWYVPWITSNLDVIRELSVFRLFAGGAASGPGGRKPPVLGDSEARRIIEAIVDDLVRLNAERSSCLAVVYLPTTGDYLGDTDPKWVDYTAQLSRQRGVAFLDLRDALRALPREEVGALFLKPGEVAFRFAANHYNDRGHAFIADAIYAGLAELPELAQILGTSQSTRILSKSPTPRGPIDR